MRFLRLPAEAPTSPALPLFTSLALMLGVMALPSTASAVSTTSEAASPAEAVVAASPFAGQVQLRLITSGLASPLYVTNAGDGSGRLFVVERAGRIRVVKNGALQAGSFLDLSSKVLAGGERGLLGLAFHPDFATNRKLYAYYTRSDGDIVLAKYTAAAGLQSASASSEQILLTIEHSQYSNHNGGMLAFGPDDYLYIGVGDGGGSGNPLGTAQNVNSLLGKVLRIDVNSGATYTSPAGNPFVGKSGLDEIWDYGLRNPWRFSFDSSTGELWIADVGQSAWEEVNREPAGNGGRNYGWNCREGLHPYAGCSGSFTNPILEYSHTYGCSITGGYVYRGSKFPDLVGSYVYGDFCSGNMWTVPAAGSSPTYHGAHSVNISSFGEGEDGEVYLTDLGGRLYQVVAPPFTDVANSPFMFDIMWLADSGITSGCGGTSFCPTTDVTRGQMAAFLARALSLPGTSTDYFTDDNSSIFEGDINRVAAADITKGCTATTFCPTTNVTRGQMAAFLARALSLPGTSTDYFTDDSSSIFEGDINRVAAAGITTGCGNGNYCPDVLVTREQMAAFLHRAFG